jgi:hypothetical protein
VVVAPISMALDLTFWSWARISMALDLPFWSWARISMALDLPFWSWARISMALDLPCLLVHRYVDLEKKGEREVVLEVLSARRDPTSGEAGAESATDCLTGSLAEWQPD